jgi:hypothetical protein
MLHRQVEFDLITFAVPGMESADFSSDEKPAWFTTALQALPYSHSPVLPQAGVRYLITIAQCWALGQCFALWQRTMTEECAHRRLEKSASTKELTQEF